MKRLSLLLASALMLLGSSGVFANEVTHEEGYTYLFNNEIDTNDHDFWVTSGWRHVVGSITSNGNSTYMWYSYSSYGGYNGTGSLTANAQEVYDYSTWTTKEINDLLVTPAVTGETSIYVKSSGSWYGTSSFIQFYKMTKNADGTFTQGDAIEVSANGTTTTDYTSLPSDWVKITIGNFSEPTYVGIRGSYAVMSWFSAGAADIELARALTIKSTSQVNSNPDAKPDGTYDVQVVTTIKNTGDYDLAPGDSAYTVTLLDPNGNSIASHAIDYALAKGATTDHQDTVVFNVSYDQYPRLADNTAYSFQLREDETNRIFSSSIYCLPVPYKPMPNIFDAATSYKDGDTFYFGKINKNTVKTLSIQNDGAQDLNITSISCPEGFSISETSLNVPAHKKKDIELTAFATTEGTHQGAMTLVADSIDPITITLNSEVLDSAKAFIDFEDNKIPTGAYNKNTSWNVAYYAVNGNNYVLQSTTDNGNKFVTPLLTVEPGETFSFDAGRATAYGTYYVKVFYSTDRQNWTLLDSIPAENLSDSAAWKSQWGEVRYALTTFTEDSVPAGNVYLGFTGNNVYIDNIYGFKLAPVAHDILIAEKKLPARVVANHPYTASVTYSNLLADEAAGSYTATIHFGADSAVVSAPALKGGEDTPVSFAITPNFVGTYPVYTTIAFADGYTVTSDTTTVTVTNEVAQERIQVGEAYVNNNANTPLSLYFKNSETMTVYDTDLLKDLPKGAKIVGVTYKGYASANLTTTVNVWMENTTDAPATSMAATDTSMISNMQNIYSGSYSFAAGGSSSDLKDVLTFNLSEPFVYDGNNLRVWVRSEANAYTGTYFQATGEMNHTWGRQSDYHGSFFNSKFAAKNTPVIYLDVERQAPAYSGTVKNEQGETISGAIVKISSGDVLYVDTTDAEGNYSLSVFQDNLSYNVLALAAGYEPYQGTVKLNGDSVQDIVLKAGTGMAIVKENIPAKGEVNSVYTADINVLNDIATDIAAADYTAEFYVNGEAVASATTVDIPSLKDRKLSFSYTPHAEGTFPTYAKVSYNGNEYTTDTADVVIAPESFATPIQVADSTGNLTNSAPWSNGWKQCESVLVYESSLINLPAGTKLTRVRFRGKFNTEETGKEAMSFFIANTNKSISDYTSALELFSDTANMTRVLDATVDSIPYGPTQNNVNIIDVALPDSFIYNGENLVLVFKGNHIGQNDNFISFIADQNGREGGQAWSRNIDYGDISNNNFGESAIPVMYLDADIVYTLSGKVADRSGAPVEGAELKLKSGDVEYYATSDAEGHYNFNVAKNTLKYDLSVSKEGFLPSEKSEIGFDSLNVVLNDTLTRWISASGTVKGSESNPYKPAAVVALAGAQVAISTADATFEPIVTPADGTFSVDSLVEGTEYTVNVSAEGYTDTTFTFTASAPASELGDIVLKSIVKEIKATGKVLGQDVVDGQIADPAPLADATVTVVDANGTEVATTTTAADGTYELTLTEAGVYTITYSHDGYIDSVVTVTAGAEDTTLADVTLITPTVDAISTINANSVKGLKGDVYSVSGQYIGRDVDLKALPRGVYIINGKKVSVK